MSLSNALTWYESTAWHQWWVNTVWKPSWTKFVSAIYGIPAGVVLAGQAISKFANDTTISSYLSQMNVPNWIPMGLSGVALIYYIAHGRD